MAKPRRGYLFRLDARVLSVGAELHRTGHDRFYGLQIARWLGCERSSVYKARVGASDSISAATRLASPDDNSPSK